eukprot:15324994-Alexandrium_andersonii.AAC.1
MKNQQNHTWTRRCKSEGFLRHLEKDVLTVDAIRNSSPSLPSPSLSSPPAPVVEEDEHFGTSGAFGSVSTPKKGSEVTPKRDKAGRIRDEWEELLELQKLRYSEMDESKTKLTNLIMLRHSQWLGKLKREANTNHMHE